VLGTDLGLRFAANSPAFARVAHGHRLIVPSSTPVREAFAIVDLEQLTLSGVVAMGDVELRPARALLFGGFAVPMPGAKLQLLAAQPDSIRLGFDLRADSDSMLRVRVLEPVRGSASCRDVTLGYSPFDFDDVTALLDAVVEDRAILRPGDSALRLTPGGRVVARIGVGERVQVPILARAAHAARIAVEVSSTTFVGWVADTALEPVPRESVGLGTIGTLGHGAGVGYGAGFGAPRTVRCPHEVPLIVEQGSMRRTVGRVHAGVSIAIDRWRDDSVEISLGGGGWWRAPGTHWLALQADLDRCELRGPPDKPFRFEHRPGDWPRRSPHEAH
jgi:hypothetical protein